MENRTAILNVDGGGIPSDDVRNGFIITPEFEAFFFLKNVIDLKESQDIMKIKLVRAFADTRGRQPPKAVYESKGSGSGIRSETMLENARERNRGRSVTRAPNLQRFFRGR